MSNSLTTGAPWRVLLRFSIPLLIGSVVQQMYQFVDSIVVGRHLGVDSLASVGATGSLIFMLIGFALGTTSGFAIPTAQAFGAEDAAAVRRSVATGTLLTAAVSVVLTILAPLLAEPILRLMQTPPELLREAVIFAQVSFLGSAATMFFNFLSAIIRAIGDSRTPLIFLVISCALNVGLVILLVGPVGWGVAGAALATVISQGVSVLLCLIYVRARLVELHVHRADWKASRDDIVDHLRLGLPMGFQQSIISFGVLVVQVRLNALGAEAVAAYTAASRSDGIAMALLGSFSVAASMYVAQNIGGGRPDRVRKGVTQGVVLAVSIAAAVGLVMIFAGGWFVRLFIGDEAPVVLDYGTSMLVINGATYWILAILFVVRGALQGLGQTLVPTISGILELVMRALAAVVLGAAFGFIGVAWSNPVAWLGAVLILVPSYWAARRRLSKLPSNPRIMTETTPVRTVESRLMETVMTSSTSLPETGAFTLLRGRMRRRLGKRARRGR